jgi:hypothetical protein
MGNRVPPPPWITGLWLGLFVITVGWVIWCGFVAVALILFVGDATPGSVTNREWIGLTSIATATYIVAPVVILPRR